MQILYLKPLGRARYNPRMARTPAQPRLTIHIEPLRDRDIGELLTVQRAAFLHDAQLYGNPFLPSLTQTLDQLRTENSDPNRVFLVAKLGTRLVGSVRAVRRNRIIYISRLMTAPDVEGCGIGGSLLTAIEVAMAESADVFALTTGTKSTANIEMYLRRGYRIVEEATDDAGVRIVNMSKPATTAAKMARDA
jgi:ribosomal protein S18 acetylase RimI-like enzyme